MADRGSPRCLSRQRLSSPEKKKRTAEDRRVQRNRYVYAGSEHARFLKFKKENKFTSTQAIRFLLDRYYQEYKSGATASVRAHYPNALSKAKTTKVPRSSSTSSSSSDVDYVIEASSSSGSSDVCSGTDSGDQVNGQDMSSRNLSQFKISKNDSDPPQKMMKMGGAESLFWWLNSDTVSQLKSRDTSPSPKPADTEGQASATMSGNGLVKRKSRLEALITGKCATSNFPPSASRSCDSQPETVDTGDIKIEVNEERNVSGNCSGTDKVFQKSIDNRQGSSPVESSPGQLTVQIKQEPVDSVLEYEQVCEVPEPHCSAVSKDDVEIKPSFNEQYASPELNETALHMSSEATPNQESTADYEPLFMECTDVTEDKPEQSSGTLNQVERHSTVTKELEVSEKCHESTGPTQSVLPKIASSHSIMDTMEGLVGNVINKYFSEYT